MESVKTLAFASTFIVEALDNGAPDATEALMVAPLLTLVSRLPERVAPVTV
jgi:hypothetical protein